VEATDASSVQPASKKMPPIQNNASFQIEVSKSNAEAWPSIQEAFLCVLCGLSLRPLRLKAFDSCEELNRSRTA
jgi:hypothetical protein